jgi:DivIVA domain-containing protein
LAAVHCRVSVGSGGAAGASTRAAGGSSWAIGGTRGTLGRPTLRRASARSRSPRSAARIASIWLCSLMARMIGPAPGVAAWRVIRRASQRLRARATPRPGAQAPLLLVILGPVVEDESSKAGEPEAEPSPAAPEQERGFGELRYYVPTDLLNVSFPAALRGYDRGAVDAYVERINRVIAELKVSASPRAAVTHALEQTEQQVSGLLQRARETGEELTASARQEADEIRAGAKAEAAELLVNVGAEADGIKA